jgi:hypothetical protein
MDPAARLCLNISKDLGFIHTLGITRTYVIAYRRLSTGSSPDIESLSPRLFTI